MKRREGTTSVVRIAPQRGEGRLAGGERSEPPDRRGITICTPAGVAGAPRAPAGARWSRRHGFQGFAKGAHPWLSSSRSFGADRTTEVVLPFLFSFGVASPRIMETPW